MRINFSTLLPFLLFYVFKGSSAQTPRDVVTYTTKSVETLECSFTSTIVLWTEQQDDGNIVNLFSYDVTGGLAQKQTNDSKYDNFDYSIEGTNGFNLVISNVDKDDGGRYRCNPITPRVVTFDVTVEVLPESLSIHCTEINACMPSAEKKADPKINCVCTATGLSSSVLEIEWEGVETFTASPTSIMNSTSGSFSIKSNITLPPPNGTASVSCSLSRYRSEIPKSLRRYTYTFLPPVCNLMHGCSSDGTSASLICSCSKGSPKVNAFSFYDSQKSPIGTQRSNSKSVQVETNKIEMFYCSGCNGVSHNQIEVHEFNCKQGQGSAAPWIVIIIGGFLLLLVVAAIICFVVKKHWCSKGKGVGPKGKQDGDKEEEHPLHDNDPRSEDPKLGADGSEVDPEGYRTNKQINQNNPKRGAGNEVKSSQKNGSNEQAAPSSTERSQGDGQDNDAQGIEEATNSAGQINEGQESSVDLNADGSKSNSKQPAYSQSNEVFQLAIAGIN